MTPKMFPPHKKDEINYYGAHFIGVSTLDESYNLLHPSSRSALNNMKHTGYIEGVDLVELIHKKKYVFIANVVPDMRKFCWIIIPFHSLLFLNTIYSTIHLLQNVQILWLKY